MNLKTLTLVVALLAATAAVVFWRHRQPVADPSLDPRVGQSLVERRTLAEIRGLSLTSEGKTVAVAADAAGAHWTVPDYFGLPADFGKLSSFIESLSSAKVARFVTASPERLERLGFGADRIELRDAAGKALWTLVLGRTADNGGRFVRFDDEKKAYLADLNAWLDTTAKNWAQTQLLTLKPEDVAAVSLQFADGTTFAAKRAESGWTAGDLPEGQEVKGAAVDSLLSQLTSLRFTETTEPGAPEATAAREHSRTATLTLKDGTTYTIALGRKPAPPPAPETRNPKLDTPSSAPVTATTPAVTIGADGKPETVALPAKTEAGEETSAETGNPKPETPNPQPAAPPPPGPVFAFITANREADPISGLMQKRAFQIGEYVFTALPAGRDALLQPKPPAPPPPAAPAKAP